MEMMLYHADLEGGPPRGGRPPGGCATPGVFGQRPLAEDGTRQPVREAPVSLPTFGPWVAESEAHDWRAGLPTLAGTRLTLRELQPEDAAALYAALTTAEVARFISPPPTSVAGFERFIAWAQQRRAEGRYACFAVVPQGQTAAVGLFQLHLLDAAHGIAEWGGRRHRAVTRTPGAAGHMPAPSRYSTRRASRAPGEQRRRGGMFRLRPSTRSLGRILTAL